MDANVITFRCVKGLALNRVQQPRCISPVHITTLST